MSTLQLRGGEGLYQRAQWGGILERGVRPLTTQIVVIICDVILISKHGCQPVGSESGATCCWAGVEAIEGAEWFTFRDGKPPSFPPRPPALPALPPHPTLPADEPRPDDLV